MSQQSWSCFKLFRHVVCCALTFDLLSAGNSSEAKMAMMAITTRSSINVKAASGHPVSLFGARHRGAFKGAASLEPNPCAGRIRLRPTDLQHAPSRSRLAATDATQHRSSTDIQV